MNINLKNIIKYFLMAVLMFFAFITLHLMGEDPPQGTPFTESYVRGSPIYYAITNPHLLGIEASENFFKNALGFSLTFLIMSASGFLLYGFFFAGVIFIALTIVYWFERRLFDDIFLVDPWEHPFLSKSHYILMSVIFVWICVENINILEKIF